MNPDLKALLKRRQIQTAQKLVNTHREKKHRQKAVNESGGQIQLIQASLQALKDAAQETAPTSPGALLDRRDQDAALKKTLQGLLAVQGMLRQELNRAIKDHQTQVAQQTKLSHKQNALKKRDEKIKAAIQATKEEAELENHTLCHQKGKT